MIVIERILCPVDESRFSARALRHAVALARWYDAQVTALWVRPPVLPESEQAQPPPQERVAAFVREAVGSNAARVEVREGGAVNEILAATAALPADLIVMGTHGLTGYDRLFLGSVTEKVLRKAPCPVLTVPRLAAGVQESSPVTFRTIICATDFSAPAARAFAYALSLAQEAGGTLLLVHAIEWFAEEGPRILAHLNLKEFRRVLEEDARQQLEALVPEDVRTWCDPDVVVGHEKAYRLVLRIAAERDADLIVLGVRGRSAIDLTLFGSTTQRVLRDATCPVLTIGAGPGPSAPAEG